MFFKFLNQVNPSDRRAPLVSSEHGIPEHEAEAAKPFIEIVPCKLPSNCKPKMTTYPQYECNTDKYTCFIDDASWLMCKSLRNMDSSKEEYDIIGKNIPPWAAYNSILANELNLTCIGAIPIIPEPANEFSTILTMFNYAEKINTKVNDEHRKTVISLDLGLYKPAKQLQFSKPECSNKWILRPGELHIVMAQLRTIGAYIDQSGLDEIWLESGIYSATTIKQISITDYHHFTTST